MTESNTPITAYPTTFPTVSFLSRVAPLSVVTGTESVLVHQAPDVFALWRGWEEETGQKQDVPYWATVWPAAQGLCQYIVANTEQFRGKKVLEIGCGGAAASIASALVGAVEVTANDIDQIALHIAGLNSAVNRVPLKFLPGNLAHKNILPRADIVLVADFFYNREDSRAAIMMLQRMKDAGSRVLIADGGRPFAPRDIVSERATYNIAVNRELEGVAERVVKIGEL